MRCPNCGMDNDEGMARCISCGSDAMNIGSITIQRPNNFFGILIPYDIYVDNVFIGNVANGETKSFPIYLGQHVLTVKQGFNKSEPVNLMISPQQRNLVFNCPIKIGFFVSKIEVQFINFYN